MYHLSSPGPGPVRGGALRRQNLLWAADELSSRPQVMAGARMGPDRLWCQVAVRSHRCGDRGDLVRHGSEASSPTCEHGRSDWNGQPWAPHPLPYWQPSPFPPSPAWGSPSVTHPGIIPALKELGVSEDNMPVQLHSVSVQPHSDTAPPWEPGFPGDVGLKPMKHQEPEPGGPLQGSGAEAGGAAGRGGNPRPGTDSRVQVRLQRGTRKAGHPLRRWHWGWGQTMLSTRERERGATAAPPGPDTARTLEELTVCPGGSRHPTRPGRRQEPAEEDSVLLTGSVQHQLSCRPKAVFILCGHLVYRQNPALDPDEQAGFS